MPNDKDVIINSSVLISYTCPQTGKNTSSPIKKDDYAFSKGMGIFYAIVSYCPICNREHAVKLVESEHWRI